MRKLEKIRVRIFNYLLAFAEFFLKWREPRILSSYEEMCDAFTLREIDKVLLVSDANVYRFGLTKYVEDELNRNHIAYTLFLDVTPNPTFKNIYDGKDVYLKNNCKGIIAIGGGSVMDCAKVIGVLINNKGPIEKYKGLFKVKHNMPTMVAFPTTCGTGSETTVAAVVRNESTGQKFPIESFRCVPKFAFLEPRLLLNLPPNVYSTTGMDALTHAIESYLNIDTTKKTKRYSLEACKIIKDNIVQGFNNKDDLKAKSNMLYASFLAGKAFTRSMVGNVHAIAHAVGGKYNLPHGYLNAIILPHILEIYKHKAKRKMSKLAIYMGIGDPNKTALENSEILINYIKELNNTFGIPTKIKGLLDCDIDVLAKTSYKEAVPLYPCPILFNIADFKKIYKSLEE
jgi:Alcohol dehydrogenase, class IV